MHTVVTNTKDLSRSTSRKTNVGYHAQIMLWMWCTSQRMQFSAVMLTSGFSFIRTHYSDSLFCTVLCPCVQTSASSSSRSVPKKTPACARREIKCGNFWIIDESQRYLNFNDFGHEGNLRIVVAIFNQCKDIKTSANSKMCTHGFRLLWMTEMQQTEQITITAMI